MKKYLFLSLPERHAAQQQLRFELADLSRIRKKETKSPNITPALHDAIAAALADGDQCFIRRTQQN